MATTRISDNQIATTTQAIIDTLSFLDGESVLRLPSGTVAQRPGTPALGTVRYNSELDTAEIYVADNGDGINGWIPVGGGGGPNLGGDSVIRCHPNEILEDAVIGATSGAEYMRGFTVGPVTVANGISVTVETGAVWKVI
tara:strand:+ start:345 stop:764 length:420 start_codon:yes stop_codon:yes gene_type:complete